MGALGHHLHQEKQGRQLEEQSLHKAGEGVRPVREWVGEGVRGEAHEKVGLVRGAGKTGCYSS